MYWKIYNLIFYNGYAFYCDRKYLLVHLLHTWHDTYFLATHDIIVADFTKDLPVKLSGLIATILPVFFYHLVNNCNLVLCQF